MPNRIWLRMVSPFLYAAVVPIVAIVVVAAIAMLERTTGLHTWYRVGDVDAAIVLAVSGIVIFSLATRCLVATMTKRSTFPPGWDEERVRKVVEHYETQTEVEALAEDEAAFEAAGQTVIEVPSELVPKIRELIAKHRAA